MIVYEQMSPTRFRLRRDDGGKIKPMDLDVRLAAHMLADFNKRRLAAIRKVPDKQVVEIRLEE